MKGKSVYIIALIAIILVMMVMIIEKPFKRPAEIESTPGALQSIRRVPVFDKLTSEDCHKIEIRKGDTGTSAILVKVNGEWRVNPDRLYPASKNNTQRIFDSLGEIRDGEVISTNPQNHVKFQVDEQTSTRVKFFGKNNALIDDVYVGKMGMNYMSPSTYVRKAGFDDVLTVEAYMMNLFQTGDEAWREKTIFSLDPEDITAFTIKAPGKPAIRVARMASDEWTCLEPDMFLIRKDAGRRMQSSFARLQASSFVEDFPQRPLDEYGLGGEATIVSASLKDYASTPTLYIGDMSESQRNQWFVRSEDKDEVYLIYQYTRDSIVKTLEELKPTPTPTPSPTSTPSEESFIENLQEEAKKKAEEIEGMTEEEQQEAIQKKLGEILREHEEKQKSKQTGTEDE